MFLQQLIRLGFCFAGIALCQAAGAQSLARGELIVSTAALDGTMFEETIMLLVHHDDDGTIGIMINRPTNLQPAEVYPDITGTASYDGALYFGGPLASNRPFLLARRSAALQDASIRIIEDVYLSGDASLLNVLDEIERTDAFSRIYAGSAQWGPGQLREEVESGAWVSLPGNAGLIFFAEPEKLWTQLSSRPLGDEVALLPAPVNEPGQRTNRATVVGR